MRARSIGAVVALCSLALAPASASANGDPASDVLLQAKIYFPTKRVSVQAAKNLKRIVDSANAKGYPIRVALIEDATDLGVVPNLLLRAQDYANFLGPEIRFAYKGDVLVVMPNSLGLTTTDETPPPAKAIAGIQIADGGSPDGLAQTAGEAVTKLAAAAGHPLVTTKKNGGNGGTVAGIAAAVLVLGLGIGGAFWVRRHQAPAAPADGTPPAS